MFIDEIAFNCLALSPSILSMDGKMFRLVVGMSFCYDLEC